MHTAAEKVWVCFWRFDMFPGRSGEAWRWLRWRDTVASYQKRTTLIEFRETSGSYTHILHLFTLHSRCLLQGIFFLFPTRLMAIKTELPECIEGMCAFVHTCVTLYTVAAADYTYTLFFHSMSKPVGTHGICLVKGRACSSVKFHKLKLTVECSHALL